MYDADAPLGTLEGLVCSMVCVTFSQLSMGNPSLWP